MLKEYLKSITPLRKLVKRGKIYMAYLQDAGLYCKNYLETAESKGRYEYRIMLLVHSLEKGMCMEATRSFGQKKAIELQEILKRKDIGRFEQELGVSILKAWVDFFKDHGWKDQTAASIEAWLGEESQTTILTDPLHPGSKMHYKKPIDTVDDLLRARYSVRDFEEKELQEEDLTYALDCFRHAPTACNRQMCRIYQVKDTTIRNKLHKIIMGISGFNKETVHYFVITYDLSAFSSSGERSQGLLNVGLVAMNFVNGLHARGIGSCFLQWSNGLQDEKKVRALLKIPANEKIGVFLGAGYYKDSSVIPCSCKRRIEEFYHSV